MTTVKMARGKRTSTEQMETIIDFMGQNKIMLSGKCHPLRTKEVDDKWLELTNMLNMVNGAKKDCKQWKLFFSEWKSRTKKKVRSNNISIKQTGGGGFRSEGLSEMDNRLMGLVGWVSVTGCVDLPAELDPGSQQDEIDIDAAVFLDEGGMVLENESCNSGNVYIETNEELSTPIEPETSRKTNTTPSGKKSLTKQKKRHLNSSSQLENAAVLYAESGKELANAVSKMAASISELASALTIFANSFRQ